MTTTRAAGRGAPTKIVIPDDITFADLHLSREAVTGAIEFDVDIIERICEASGLDITIFRDAPEDNLAMLFAAWYQAHLDDDGEPDPVFEALRREVSAEREVQ